MLVFRSEEHLERWLARTGHARGGSMPLAQLWAMVRLWYTGRLDQSWRGRSAQEFQAILDSVGLEGDAWRML